MRRALAGTPVGYTYGYDACGPPVEVRRGAELRATYTWDDNGNRLSGAACG